MTGRAFIQSPLRRRARPRRRVRHAVVHDLRVRVRRGEPVVRDRAELQPRGGETREAVENLSLRARVELFHPVHAPHDVLQLVVQRVHARADALR
eukprot:30920-Pelagococcus_subviridis.AAC.25